VRELENAIHRAVILATENTIRWGHLVSSIELMPRADVVVPRDNEELKEIKKIARQKSVEQIERLFLLEALKRSSWNVTQAAAETGMQRSNFQALMQKHDIHIRKKKEGSEDNGA
jgi:transcriptional regulator with GAF, ATPase, and Fis domain